MSINLETETIKNVMEANEPIDKWEVWFQTPFGLCKTLKEAKDYCLANDLEIKLCITPVAVARSNLNYEVSMR